MIQNYDAHGLNTIALREPPHSNKDTPRATQMNNKKCTRILVRKYFNHLPHTHYKEHYDLE